MGYDFSSTFSSNASSISFLGIFPLLKASVSVLCSFGPCSSSDLVRTCSSLPCFSIFLPSPLLPAFWFFLVCILVGSSSSRLLSRSDLSSLCDGVALWDESVDLVGSFAFFFGSFSRTLYTTGWFCCRSMPLFSSSCFLGSCEFFFYSSHMCCVLVCGLSWVCAPWLVVFLFGILSPPLSVLLFCSLHTVQFLRVWGWFPLVFPMVSLVVFLL